MSTSWPGGRPEKLEGCSARLPPALFRLKQQLGLALWFARSNQGAWIASWVPQGRALLKQRLRTAAAGSRGHQQRAQAEDADGVAA